MTASARIKHLRVAAERRRGVTTVQSVVEDALRTQISASGPAAQKGVLIIRKWHLETIGSRRDQSRVNSLISRLLRAAIDGAVGPNDPRAKNADAVLFPDPAAPYLMLAEALVSQNETAQSWPFRAVFGEAVFLPRAKACVALLERAVPLEFAPALLPKLLHRMAPILPEALPDIPEELALRILAIMGIQSRSEVATGKRALTETPSRALISAYGTSGIADCVKSLPKNSSVRQLAKVAFFIHNSTFSLNSNEFNALMSIVDVDKPLANSVSVQIEDLPDQEDGLFTRKEREQSELEAGIVDNLKVKNISKDTELDIEKLTTERSEEPIDRQFGVDTDALPIGRKVTGFTKETQAMDLKKHQPSDGMAEKRAEKDKPREVQVTNVANQNPEHPNLPVVTTLFWEPTELGGFAFLITLVNRLFGAWLNSSEHLAAQTGVRLLQSIWRELGHEAPDPFTGFLFAETEPGEMSQITPFFAPLPTPEESSILVHKVVDAAGWRMAVRQGDDLPFAVWQGRAGDQLHRQLTAAKSVKRGIARPLRTDAALDAALHCLRDWCADFGFADWHKIAMRPARFDLTETHIDFVFDAALVDLNTRRWALDVSPGWCHWLMKVVTIHYDFGEDHA